MKYVSLLRGINVSGQKSVRMSDLKSLYEDLGLRDVVTYIQSGNVVFSSDSKDKNALAKKITQGIKKQYLFDVPVEIRTHAELKKIIQSCPFGSVDVARDGSKVLVSFLSQKPDLKLVQQLLDYATSSEKLAHQGKEIYLFCPDGYGKSKLSNAFLEKKLDVQATTRNWKSIHKLTELSAP